MAKKYLSIFLYILLYLFILVFTVFCMIMLWWKVIKNGFLLSNFNFSTILGFGLALLLYGLILKKRKMSLIKACNFSKISIKNLCIVILMSLAMGLFTCCVTNTSLVINDFPVLRGYLGEVEYGSSNLVIFIITMSIAFIGEEMIFRGTMFNEVRRCGALYPSVIISASIYGILNALTQGLMVGIYSWISAIIFTLIYVYMSSIWASVTLQAGSLYMITIVRKTSLWDQLAGLGDGVLYIITAACIIVMVGAFYILYKEGRKLGNIEKFSRAA